MKRRPHTVGNEAYEVVLTTGFPRKEEQPDGIQHLLRAFHRTGTHLNDDAPWARPYVSASGRGQGTKARMDRLLVLGPEWRLVSHVHCGLGPPFKTKLRKQG